MRRSIVLRTAALVTGGALAASGLLAATTTAQAATACRVDYSLVGQWSGGFQANLVLTNLGDSQSGWTLTFDWPAAGQQVSQGWSAVWSQSGTRVTARNADWNAGLASGGTVSLGLVGTHTGSNPAPASFSLNGTACTGTGSGGSSSTTTTTTTARTTTSTTSRTTSTTTRTTTTTTSRTTTTTGSSGCPATGHITYTLARASNPTADQQDAYSRITTAMDQALAVYNCYVPATKALSISYVPSVTTADGNYNGAIRFGNKSTMQQITAMHEIGHTLGVGTYSGWSSKLSNGVWTGSAANTVLRSITGDQSAAVHGDSQHFWPYGLNYTSEVTGTGDLINHCKIVAGLRKDMGL